MNRRTVLVSTFVGAVLVAVLAGAHRVLQPAHASVWLIPRGEA